MSQDCCFQNQDSRTYDPYAQYLASRAKEEEAWASFHDYLEENADLLSYISRQGDGRCGSLIQALQEALLDPIPEGRKPHRKKKISHGLRTEVFERDMYRCLRCGDHRALCADHIVPEIDGGDAELDNLQTLCKSCNSWKGTKTIDFRGIAS